MLYVIISRLRLYVQFWQLQEKQNTYYCKIFHSYVYYYCVFWNAKCCDTTISSSFQRMSCSKLYRQVDRALRGVNFRAAMRLCSDTISSRVVPFVVRQRICQGRKQRWLKRPVGSPWLRVLTRMLFFPPRRFSTKGGSRCPSNTREGFRVCVTQLRKCVSRVCVHA